MIERRIAVSVRASGTEKRPVLEGHAAVFNSLSRKIYTRSGSYFYEKVSPGAFKRAISQGKTVANLHHDMQRALASQRAGTLHLEEDGRGLFVRCEINPEVSYARDAWHAAGGGTGKPGTLSSMSFCFVCGGDDDTKNSKRGDMWDELTDDDMNELEENYRAPKRTLLDVDSLSDVAFLTEGQGAYDAADCYSDLRIAFPEGVPQYVETRSGNVFVPLASGIVVPSHEETNEIAARYARLRSALK